MNSRGTFLSKNKFQLPQTDLRDALRYVVHNGGRSVCAST